MKLTFKGPTLQEIRVQCLAFLEDVSPTENFEVKTDTPKANKEKAKAKPKAVEPEVEEPKAVEDTDPPAEDEAPEEMDIDDMREAMRQDMMKIYVTEPGQDFVKAKLAEYKLTNFNTLADDKVPEVLKAVREFIEKAA